MHPAASTSGLMVMAVGLGLAGVFHAEPRLHTGLKYAGAAYLLYLAWRLGALFLGVGVLAWAIFRQLAKGAITAKQEA